MGDENLLEYLHFELVNYTVNEKKVSLNWNYFFFKLIFYFFQENDTGTLEYLGFSTGYRIIERLTKEMPRFKDELDTVKFICTDFWSSIFKKQIDNLRTNHQGKKQLLWTLSPNLYFLKRTSLRSI